MTEIVDSVLVVEDEEPWFERHRRLLDALGVKYVWVKDLDELDQVLDRTEFSVAIIDLCLDVANANDQSGLGAIERIAQISLRTKSILVTGHGTLSVGREVLKRHGAYDAFEKGAGFDRMALRDAVTSGLVKYAEEWNSTTGPAVSELRGDAEVWEFESRLMAALDPRGGAVTLKTLTDATFRDFMPTKPIREGVGMRVDRESGHAFSDYWSLRVGHAIGLVLESGEAKMGEATLWPAEDSRLLRSVSERNIRGRVYELDTPRERYA